MRLLVVAAVVALAGCWDDDAAGLDLLCRRHGDRRAGRPTLDGPASPPDLEQLDGALLGADDVGVPDSWGIHDLDEAIMDRAAARAADPFQGFLDCPDVEWRPEDRWIQRTFTSPDQPLDDGILRIDVIAAVQDEAPTQEQLAACIPTSPEATVDVEEVEVTPLAGEPPGPMGPAVPATEVTLTAAPSADVPYPSSYVLVTVNQDGRTVTVAAGGVDLGVPFADSTRELVGRILARL